MAVAQLQITDLIDMQREATCNRNYGECVKIAHNTYAIALTHGMEVTYHGNRILFKPYGASHYEIGNAGWHTTTTSGRLDQITRANGGGTVNIKNGVMRYTAPSGATHDMHGTIIVDSASGEALWPYKN